MHKQFFLNEVVYDLNTAAYKNVFSMLESFKRGEGMLLSRLTLKITFSRLTTKYSQ